MSQPGWYKPTDYRSGIGYDIHRLVVGRALVLGGVRIPYALGLKGHSDADVLLHAVMDAVLGAAGQGDIGEHFPDTSRKYKDISSLLLLEQVCRKIELSGLKVVNVDCVLLAEEPENQFLQEADAENIARALNIEVCHVNVKATTNEGLGFVGRKEGMAAYATAVVRSTEH